MDKQLVNDAYDYQPVAEPASSISAAGGMKDAHIIYFRPKVSDDLATPIWRMCMS